MTAVLAVHPVRDDVSAAQHWGPVVYANTEYVYGDELADDGSLPTEVTWRLSVAAHKFDPATDRLLIAGDHVQIVALSAMLGRLYGKFRCLRYDRVAAGYLDVLVNTCVPDRDLLSDGDRATVRA